MPATPVPAATRRRVLDAALAAERDPSADVSVALLAEHAGLSSKHFQRAFRAVLGESPKSYVRRLRLQSAAYYLKWSDLSVLAIASLAGFETHAGFTKAFVRAYGCSPTDFRASRDVVPYVRAKPGAGARPPEDQLTVTPLVVRIQQEPSRRVAARRHVGPVEKTAEVWPGMVDWMKGRGLLDQHTMLLGIHNDYWDANASDRYRYDAAVVVPDDFEPDDTVNTFSIPGGPVAMTEFAGSLGEADGAWRRFVDQWLPISGFYVRAKFAYDRYPVDLFEAGPLKRLMQALTGIRATLCLPVAR